MIYKGLLIARSYEGKDSSKFVKGSAVYGGGGGWLSSPEHCSTELTTAICIGTIRWLILLARPEIFNQINYVVWNRYKLTSSTFSHNCTTHANDN